MLLLKTIEAKTGNGNNCLFLIITSLFVFNSKQKYIQYAAGQSFYLLPTARLGKLTRWGNLIQAVKWTIKIKRKIIERKKLSYNNDQN